MQIQYQTQRLSLRFFMLMLVLFVFQVAYGLLLSVQQVDPTVLAGVVNFNTARAEHLNLGILWILCGFIGAILFAIFAIILLVLFVIVVGPLLWIVLLLLVELLVWVVLAIAGLIAWLVLRRPWRVAVVDPEGTMLASAAVRGRRAARHHAVVVERRLGDGATPTAAVTTP